MAAGEDRIELLILDVDGVLTDGRIILTPAGEEIKEFHVRDGSAIVYWRRLGKQVAIVSGRGSPAVEHRARELGIEHVRLSVADKLPVCEALLEQLAVRWDQAAVMGDDLGDLPLLTRCGLAIAPADAAAEVRQRAHLVTQATGGRGAVREAIEHILRQGGLWQQVVDRYLSTSGAKRV